MELTILMSYVFSLNKNYFSLNKKYFFNCLSGLITYFLEGFLLCIFVLRAKLIEFSPDPSNPIYFLDAATTM